MKISGTARLSADRATVFNAFQSPDVLVRTLPGCQRLEVTGPDRYKMTVAAGVGSIKGVYDGQVELSNKQEPTSFRMTAQGAGAAGTIGADVLVTLAEHDDGGTALIYEADAVVGGMIGGVGQRMLTGVSKKMAAEFFSNVDTLLAAGVAATAQLPADGAAPEPSGLASLGLPPDPSTGAAPSAVRSAAAPSAPAHNAGGGAAPSAAGGSSAAAGSAPGVGQVFTAPGGAATGSSSPGFLVGVAAGAGIALAGVLVGAWIAGRRRR
jgi:uncharacterized protein